MINTKNKEELLGKVIKLAEDIENYGVLKNKAIQLGIKVPELPEDLPVRISNLEKDLSPDKYNSAKEWKNILETSRLRLVIHWLDGIGMDLFDEIRFANIDKPKKKAKKLTNIVISNDLANSKVKVEEKKEKIVVMNYGKEYVYDDREKAIKFYQEAVMCSEGSEQSRYSTILCQLLSGCTHCSDEE